MKFFLVYLFLEVFVTSQFASEIGFFFTFIEIILSAIMGGYIIKTFPYTMADNISTLAQGEMDSKSFITLQIFTLVGGILLIIPGFFSDILGLLMQFEFFATLIASILLKKKDTDLKSENKKENDNEIIDVEVIEYKPNT